MKRCLLWVVRIILSGCSDGTFDPKGWHFTPHNRLSRPSKVPCLAIEEGLPSTLRQASATGPLLSPVYKGIPKNEGRGKLYLTQLSQVVGVKELKELRS